MVTEQAVVVAVEGGRAWVEAQRLASCGGCESSASCGTSAFSKVVGNRSFRVEADNALGAKIGDRVTLTVSDRGLMRGAALLYLLPLLVLMFAALGMEWLLMRQWGRAPEWLVIGGALVAAGLAVFGMRQRGWFERQDLVPTIVSVDSMGFVDFGVSENNL